MESIRRISVVPVALVLVAALVALAVRAGEDDGESRAAGVTSTVPVEDPDPTTTAAPSTTAATTTTTAPPVFGPLLPSTEVRAVRTPTDIVLPVIGGVDGAWQVLTPCSNQATVTGQPLVGAHVVLDPGHGGSEPGAVGPTGLTEKQVNLDIAQRTATLLEAQGATVVLTRTSDIRLTLEARAAIAHALDPEVFVSIHHNAAPIATSPTPGPELYHQLADPESKRLAGLLWEELWNTLAPYGDEWAIGDGPGARARQSVRSGDDFYGILRRGQGIPTVLTEALYLSDPSEEALLADADFRQAEAGAIARAITRLLSTDDPGSGYVPTKVSDVPAGPGGGSAGCVDPPLG